MKACRSPTPSLRMCVKRPGARSVWSGAAPPWWRSSAPLSWSSFPLNESRWFAEAPLRPAAPLYQLLQYYNKFKPHTQTGSVKTRFCSLKNNQNKSWQSAEPFWVQFCCKQKICNFFCCFYIFSDSQMQKFIYKHKLFWKENFARRVSSQSFSINK